MIVISLLSLFAVVTGQFMPKEACDALVANYKRVCPVSPVPTTTTAAMTTTKKPMNNDELPECKPELPPVSLGYCPMLYNGKCFWVEPRYGEVKYKEGRDICVDQGGMPANIYSEDHYYMVMGHLRVFAAKIGYFDAWIGMTYSNKSETTYLSYGTKAPFIKWYSGDPSPNKCCNMAVMARTSWESTSQHMYTWPPTSITLGVVCEK